ncbi:MAG: PVC-type heme-binding CxxCH protein [Limisphaerales bacterium]
MENNRERRRGASPAFACLGLSLLLLTGVTRAAELPGANPWAGATLPSLDVKYAGLPPEEAAKAMILPPGFSAKLFAGEPDVKQPIAFAIDDRGRLWVAENYTYPVHAPEGQGKDRILIFEDTDGDGKFDKRTVFMEGLNMVTGLEVGFGGVWVGAAPYLMYIPIKEGDDKPDGPPKILLDGWAWQDTHETFNTFTWGPDGWLYGCHGVFTHSNVGKPGAPDNERTKINAGVWRYHPTKHTFEVFAEGTSNPWGLDFDARGQCFIEACVIPHLFHVIQGAHYERQAGQDFNPNVYADIKTIADHLHYRGNQWNTNDVKGSSELGGGHAHAGLMVYQGGSWPEKYRGQIFMNNIHGSRINMDIPEPKGSGFVGHHGPDFINFNDAWSQVINLTWDQDGSVYLIDWYDKNQCHHTDPNAHDRSNGRIFKIAYHDQKWTPVDLQMKLERELLDLLVGKNEWYARHVQRVLQERGGNREIHAALTKILRRDPDETHKLRALWALHVTGGLTEKLALSELRNRSDYIRAWIVQLLCEDKKPSPAALTQFAFLAQNDPSPVVRLYLAAALPRMPLNQRSPILEGLLAHAEDANDHNLPLMYWYAAEPVVGQNPAQAVALMAKTKIPLVREYITRRMASGR